MYKVKQIVKLKNKHDKWKHAHKKSKNEIDVETKQSKYLTLILNKIIRSVTHIYEKWAKVSQSSFSGCYFQKLLRFHYDLITTRWIRRNATEPINK